MSVYKNFPLHTLNPNGSTSLNADWEARGQTNLDRYLVSNRVSPIIKLLHKAKLHDQADAFAVGLMKSNANHKIKEGLQFSALTSIPAVGVLIFDNSPKHLVSALLVGSSLCYTAGIQIKKLADSVTNTYKSGREELSKLDGDEFVTPADRAIRHQARRPHEKSSQNEQKLPPLDVSRLPKFRSCP